MIPEKNTFTINEIYVKTKTAAKVDYLLKDNVPIPFVLRR